MTKKKDDENQMKCSAVILSGTKGFVVQVQDRFHEGPVVILSEAKDLSFSGSGKILRSAQNDMMQVFACQSHN